MGEPISGARDAIVHLKYGRRDTIIIHSVKSSDPSRREAIAKWMNFYDIPFDAITDIKPNADIYLDDKAVRFSTWETFTNDLEALSA